MSQVQIVCINKDGGNHSNPHEGITHYGWLNPATNKGDKVDRAAMVNWLMQSGNFAYVKDRFGNIAYCKVVQNRIGNRFLQTEADGKLTDNLLNLFECR